MQVAGLLKTIFSLVGFKISRCFSPHDFNVVIKGLNIYELGFFLLN